MQINSLNNNQNFNARLFGDYKQIMQLSVDAGLSSSKAKSLFEKVHQYFPGNGYDIWMMKPTTKTADKNSAKWGAVVVATKDGVCKGIKMDPVTCLPKNLLYKYMIAVKKLASQDFSNTAANKANLTWIG